jgi:hypothetical protein
VGQFDSDSQSQDERIRAPDIASYGLALRNVSYRRFRLLVLARETLTRIKKPPITPERESLPKQRPFVTAKQILPSRSPLTRLSPGESIVGGIAQYRAFCSYDSARRPEQIEKSNLH